jgi:hypothetical protein
MGIPELADQFARTLPDQDRHLVELFLASEARNIMAYELRARSSQVRNQMFASLDIKNPGSPVQLPEEGTRRGDTLFDRISQWREFVPMPGFNGRGKLVSEMTKHELLESANYDAARINKFGWKMVVKQRLAADLNDEERVMDHYQPEQIAELISRTRTEMASGKFSIRLRPAPFPTNGLRAPRHTDPEGDGDLP